MPTKKKPTAAKAVKAPSPKSLVTEDRHADLKAIAEILHQYDLTEIEVEDEHTYYHVRRGGEPVVTAAQPSAHSAAPTAAPAPGAPPATGPNKAETSDGNVSYITSPFVGTFYRSPGPDSAPFVDVGTRIKKGQVLCIVEAMKLMNEIEAEIDGVVVQCLVENGHPVEYGEPLYKVKQG